MSKDPVLMSTYFEGGAGDIYTTIGDTMGINRAAGKQLVLSLMYGVGPDKIARTIGCTVVEAKELLTRFSAQFPSVSEYRAKVLGVVRNKGYVSTIYNRRRYLPDITSNQTGFRASAERQAFNTRIQGSAADIIKLAMIRAHNSLPKEAKLILTVHDELVTLTPDSFVESTTETIREAMEGIQLLDIPLIADIKVVQRWGEAKD
jgi:DNA polymerase-1